MQPGASVAEVLERQRLQRDAVRLAFERERLHDPVRAHLVERAAELGVGRARRDGYPDRRTRTASSAGATAGVRIAPNASPAAAHAAAMQSADGDSQANGSLMRASPLGIWGQGLLPDDLAEIAREDSRVTHPNPVCQEACAVYVVAIAHAVASMPSPGAS